MDHVLIVGASLAGLRAAETLRDEGYAGGVTLLGAEEHRPYDRPPLSKEVLAGEMDAADLALSAAGDLDVEWRLGERAVGLDTGSRAVKTASGETLNYDGLILATGSRARMLPVFDPGHDGVHVLRTLGDSLRLRAALRPGVRLLIVGCGFIGVEVAASARTLGVEVTVVGLDPPLAPAGPLASAVAADLMTRAGVRLHAGCGIVGARAEGQGHRVELSDGTVVEADEIVVAVGSAPNIEWLADSGVGLGDGVLCDATLHAEGSDDVVAAGDIARWPNPLYGDLSMRVEHWTNAVEQGSAAARALLAGRHRAQPFKSVPSFWSDHFGIRLQSVGLPSLADRFDVLAGDPAGGTFAAAAYAGDVLVGGVAYGLPRALVPVRLKLARTPIRGGLS
jgi:NADPH-dependent 2,4-dienoyl-CoA reductase/sulfur reductase-like enzyme